ncbi:MULTISPECIES: hypothetical protein [Maricaulis]|uniref:hypothetical protein n=1 Tax=Maricaulaceae TaxID=2800061 RepID=UPI00063FA0C5|nr:MULTISPECIES: hypothetical protein [Maricaulis]MDF1769107.1 hypothetical protein [Maricaulis sp.]
MAEFFAQYSEHDHIARGVSGLGDTQQVISITWADNGPPELNKNVPGANELDEVIAMRQLNLIALGDWVADQADHPLFLIKALDA